MVAIRTCAGAACTPERKAVLPQWTQSVLKGGNAVRTLGDIVERLAERSFTPVRYRVRYGVPVIDLRARHGLAANGAVRENVRLGRLPVSPVAGSRADGF